MGPSSVKGCMLGGCHPCASDNLLQLYSLEKVLYSEKDLPESCAQKIFAF